MKRIFAWAGITSGVLGILVLSSVWVVNKRENVPDAAGLQNYVQKWGGNLPNSDAFAHQDFGFLSKQCRLLEKAQKYDEAVAACEQAIALDPNRENVDLWTNRSNALLKLARYVEAVGSYDQVLQREPNNSFALTQRCAALSALGKRQDAIASCEQALRVNSHWGNATPALARKNKIIALLRKSGKFPDGTTANEQEPGINSNDAISLNQQGRLLQRLKQYEQALTYYNRAISIKQDYAEAWNNKGVSLWNLGKYSEAEAATKRAIDINPKYTQGWFNHGRILSSLQQYERAVKAYDNALSSDVNAVEQSTRASILTNKGAALWHLKNYNLALNSTNEAIQRYPNFFEAWYNKGVFLLNLQDYNQALQAYYKANSISPNNAYVWTGIGMALAGKGQQQEALTAFKKASNINPNDADIQQQRKTSLSTIANGKKR